MNRLDTLKAAAECVCGSREEDYGSPEDNFAVIAALWTAYTAPDLIRVLREEYEIDIIGG